MRKLIFLTACFLACCNPYQPYYFTHYHIIANIDPESGLFDVNLQMVYLPPSNQNDSIVFLLDEEFAISSLSAQELVRYEFYEGGRLVLYIQEPVAAGDQLNISMSYAGITGYKLSPGEDYLSIGSSMIWFPVNDKIKTMTYRLDVNLPEGYRVDGSNFNGRSMNTYRQESRKPVSSIPVRIIQDAI